MGFSGQDSKKEGDLLRPSDTEEFPSVRLATPSDIKDFSPAKTAGLFAEVFASA